MLRSKSYTKIKDNRISERLAKVKQEVENLHCAKDGTPPTPALYHIVKTNKVLTEYQVYPKGDASIGITLPTSLIKNLSQESKTHLYKLCQESNLHCSLTMLLDYGEEEQSVYVDSKNSIFGGSRIYHSPDFVKEPEHTKKLYDFEYEKKNDHMNSSTSNNFLFKTKNLRTKDEENKRNPIYYSKVKGFKDNIRCPVIPRALEEISNLSTYTGVFSIDFVPAEDFECAQASIYRSLPNDYYQVGTRQWYDSALKEAYDEYKMFIYTPTSYQIPKVITVEEPKRFDTMMNSTHRSIMNLTYQKSTPNLLKNGPKQGDMSMKNLQGTQDYFLQELNPQEKIIIEPTKRTSEEASQKNLNDFTSTDLIYDQILIHKSQKKHKEEDMSKKIEEMLPNGSPEFREFIYNLLISEKTELENLVIPNNLDIFNEDNNSNEKSLDKDFVDKLSGILNKKYNEEEILTLLKQLFTISRQDQRRASMPTVSPIESSRSDQSQEDASKLSEPPINFEKRKKSTPKSKVHRYLGTSQQEIIVEQKEEDSSNNGEIDADISMVTNKLDPSYEKKIAPEFKPTIIDIMKPEDGAVSYKEARRRPMVYSSYAPSEGNINYESLMGADEVLQVNFKKFTEDKQVEELKKRYELKHHKFVKQWVSKMRRDLLPITHGTAVHQPSKEDSKIFKKKISRIHSTNNKYSIRTIKDDITLTRPSRETNLRRSRNGSNMAKRAYTLMDTGKMLISQDKPRSIIRTPMKSNENSAQIRESTPSAWSQKGREGVISPKSTSTFKEVRFGKEPDFINKYQPKGAYYKRNPGSLSSRSKPLNKIKPKKQKATKPKIPKKYMKYLDKLGGQEFRQDRRDTQPKIWDPPLITALSELPVKPDKKFYEKHIVEKNRSRFPKITSRSSRSKPQKSASSCKDLF
ncbi:unnamed protein product [Moneuplotes crassus]|uniref:Uncharacterized protein n=2 Tax=Euplotes crassus TaxID=5936 RepID=A0AAD1UJ64_EUPCR|nr:unnamed protein product [Moneuplotes crassus]